MVLADNEVYTAVITLNVIFILQYVSRLSLDTRQLLSRHSVSFVIVLSCQHCQIAVSFQAALLLLPEEFTLERLYTEIVSLSYRGDFRMSFGEDKNKIGKIVAGNRAYMDELYVPLLKADKRISLSEQKVLRFFYSQVSLMNHHTPNSI